MGVFNIYFFYKILNKYSKNINLFYFMIILSFKYKREFFHNRFYDINKIFLVIYRFNLMKIFDNLTYFVLFYSFN